MVERHRRRWSTLLVSEVGRIESISGNRFCCWKRDFLYSARVILLALYKSEILTVMPGRWSNGHGAAPGSIPYHGRLSGPRKRIKRVKTKNYKLY